MSKNTMKAVKLTLIQFIYAGWMMWCLSGIFMEKESELFFMSLSCCIGTIFFIIASKNRDELDEGESK